MFYDNDKACLCRPFRKDDRTIGDCPYRSPFRSGDIHPIVSLVRLESTGESPLTRREKTLLSLVGGLVEDIVTLLFSYFMAQLHFLFAGLYIHLYGDLLYRIEQRILIYLVWMDIPSKYFL